MMRLPDKMTYGESLGPAMQITEQDKANEYYEALMERHMRITDDSRKRAEQVIKSNLGYYAGYYSSDVIDRVQRFYNCSHPIFGKTQPTPEQAFKKGQEFGEKLRRKRNTMMD
jgi:hypothetical protein